MEILLMIAIPVSILGLIWLLVREPSEVVQERKKRAEELNKRWEKREAEQTVRVNAGIPRSPSATKVVDKPKAKESNSSSRSSSSGSSRSSNSDDGFSSYSGYSSWGGDSGSSYSSDSSSSCDSSSSSSSSSSCD